ncbi:hemolysin-III related-domain-containing protein [Coniella lustricola]|uniref:Hemolysin-III related-domain-containing protein n=1 Tax=Coniella lustricola TaxID=2025994 RepID=A0A2T3AN98_9PEZI|nr:hemolysin-III related-domain-containing protein [Coniella lustricola]
MAYHKDAQAAVRRRRGSSASSQHSTSLLHTVKAVESKIESALLWAWDDLPDWRRDNAFIHTGYRPTSNSYRGSFDSLFSLHNESVNIWTHLLGSIVFTVAGLTSLYLFEAIVAARYATATTADVVVFACFFAGAFSCLGMSATFHALCNHSPEVAKWGNKLDYSGIVLLIVGSYVPALYYGFYCLPRLMGLYLSGIVLLGLGCLTVSWFEHFRTPEWRPYRAMMFVGLGVSGVVPVLHGLTIYGFSELNERMGLSWVLLQGVLYISGAFLYAVRWPERTSPKKYDIWGSSHQIFHVLVVLAAASHLYGMTLAFDFHHGALGARC